MKRDTNQSTVAVPKPGRSLAPWGSLVVVLLATLMMAGSPLIPAGADGTTAVLVNVDGHYPVGTPDPSEPSGLAPPGAGSMVGFQLTYVSDFLGTTVPPGWNVFTGIPGGSPGGHFGISHVVVRDGELQLFTFRNPHYGNRWMTGGLCQCGVAQVYGAYFVRSRVTGRGPNEVALLWPLTNQWPPEIDFNETGGSIIATGASVHFGAQNTVVRRSVSTNITQWHTWGVIWTPTTITYTLDGRVWGDYNVARNIPTVPMTLDFEQRTLCPLGRQCPSRPQTMFVDWVAEYSK